MNDFLTNKEFAALKQLHDNYIDAFNALPEYIRDAFYIRVGSLALFGK